MQESLDAINKFLLTLDLYCLPQESDQDVPSDHQTRF